MIENNPKYKSMQAYNSLLNVLSNTNSLQSHDIYSYNCSLENKLPHARRQKSGGRQIEMLNTYNTNSFLFMNSY